MRPAVFVSEYLTLLIVVASGFLSVAYAEREFPVPAGASAPVADLAPRCYAVVVINPRNYAIELPSLVRLTDQPGVAEGAPLLFRGEILSSDSVARDRGNHLGPVVWRPIGRDSLDIHFLGWPTSLHMRLPSADTAAVGRMRLSGDAAYVLGFNGRLHQINWDPMFRVAAHRRACAERQSLQGSGFEQLDARSRRSGRAIGGPSLEAVRRGVRSDSHR